MADEIDYKIYGEDLQFVEIGLDYGETVISESGAMLYMRGGIKMDTTASTKNEGVVGKLFSIGKRVLTGESLFLSTFTNMSSRKAYVAFAAPYPGKIVPLNLKATGSILCQKDSFLCGARGVDIDIAFTKKFGTGLFGGEGFILQKLKGDGYVFVHAGGTLYEINLEEGEKLKVDTGCIVAFSQSVKYDIEFVSNIKTAFFGGEGLFLAVLIGPGKVYLQSLPFSRLADRIYKAMPQHGGKRGEGSILGGLGNILDGDNKF